MKLSETLLLTALFTPTILLIAAAVVSLASPEPEPRYQAPAVLASSNGAYPADEDPLR